MNVCFTIKHIRINWLTLRAIHVDSLFLNSSETENMKQENLWKATCSHFHPWKKPLSSILPCPQIALPRFSYWILAEWFVLKLFNDENEKFASCMLLLPFAQCYKPQWSLALGRLFTPFFLRNNNLMVAMAKNDQDMAEGGRETSKGWADTKTCFSVNVFKEIKP